MAMPLTVCWTLWKTAQASPMTRIAHDITIGSSRHATPKQTSLVSLEVHHALGQPGSRATVVLSDPEAKAKVGDPVRISAGPENKTKALFTGKVQSVASICA